MERIIKKRINSWAVGIMRFGAGVLEQRVGELKVLDRKTRKILTMRKVLHPKSDAITLYVSRKENGRGLMSSESKIRSEKNNLGWYFKNSNETQE